MTNCIFFRNGDLKILSSALPVDMLSPWNETVPFLVDVQVNAPPWAIKVSHASIVDLLKT